MVFSPNGNRRPRYSLPDFRLPTTQSTVAIVGSCEYCIDLSYRQATLQSGYWVKGVNHPYFGPLPGSSTVSSAAAQTSENPALCNRQQIAASVYRGSVAASRSS